MNECVKVIFAFLNMKIAIHTKVFATDAHESNVNFMHEIFKRLIKSHPEHEFIFIDDRPNDATYLKELNVSSLVFKTTKENPLWWSWWLNIKLPAVLKKQKADVLVSVFGISSLKTKLPQCLIIHELDFLHYPELFKKTHQYFYNQNTKKTLPKVNKIITRSHLLKNEILKNKAVDAGKIALIHGAAREMFQLVEPQSRIAIREKFTSGAEYFIYAGPIYLQKNLRNLLKAFSVFKKRQKSNMKLVLVGVVDKKSIPFTEILKTFKYRHDVLLINEPEEEELVNLLASAYALINPCINEGFSLTLIEAMACQIPVITSSITEIESDAVLTIDPENVDDIAQKMMLIYKDENMRSTLIKKGIEINKQFNWDKTAQLVWKCIEKTIG